MTTREELPARPVSSDEAGDSGRVPVRRLRRDAERNRQRILQAATEVFTERGLEATLDDVARQAGVGVGTVYRRFPDKAALVDALFEDRISALIALVERAKDEPDPWAAVCWFVEHSAQMLAVDRGLRQILMFAAQGHDQAAYVRDRMRPAVASLLGRAQAAGQVRADLSATDIPVIELMLSTAAEYTRHVQPEVWRRYLTLMLDGLRASRADATPLPQPALTPDEVLAAVRDNPLSRRLARARASDPSEGQA
jgi:AcrR family transcriptional regulator